MKELKNKIKASVSWWLGRCYLERCTEVLPECTYLVSYPKSGNTWTRFIFANLNFPDEQVDFSSIEGQVPDSYLTLKPTLRAGVYGKFIKSHSAFDFRVKNAIQIVRDPRSVCVSYYHHLRRRQGHAFELKMGDFVEQFLDGSLDNFGCWNKNVGSWLGACEGTRGFTTLRYEDMLTCGVEYVYLKLSEVLPNITYDAVQRAMNLSSIERMKDSERRTGKLWKAKQMDAGQGSFVRAGQINEWESVLDENTIRLIESRCGALMKRLGYELMY